MKQSDKSLDKVEAGGVLAESDTKFTRGEIISYILIRIPWFLICLFTLGFPAKYRERLRLFKGLHKINLSVDPENPLDVKYKPWSTPPVYSDRGNGNNSLLTMRQKQQEEWDRLNITVRSFS
ncbi:unnamed protein product [Rhizoctonia solani]|uniref:Uncharacterized protein n=1 Tax=Rhizoctonia solani TaxID=456999 RepID=A0A8H3BB24_9AGAM|nr:unnamed protein product [Rhizoctonia solani]